MGNATAALLGSMLGGIIGVYMIGALWEFFVFKRVMADPVKGKLLAVMAGYFTASTLYGFATADGPFNFAGFGYYVLGAAVVGFFAVRRGIKLRDQMAPEDHLQETFR